MSAIALFSHIEQQLNALRAKALLELEQKANERGEQLHRLSDSYTQLKSDFEYNVQLLDDRDSELAKRDAQLAHHEIKLEEQLALHEHQQQELAAANEECEMQRSLLQQAEAVWQAQHDRLSSELAQEQHSSQRALAEVQAKHDSTLETLQAAHEESRKLLEMLAAAQNEKTESSRQRDVLTRKLQDAEEQCSGMSQQHSMASAEQTASAAALREKVEVLGKEFAQECARAASAKEREAILIASEERLQQRLAEAQAEHQAESGKAKERLRALQGQHAADLAAADAKGSSEQARHAQQRASVEAHHKDQVIELQRHMDDARRECLRKEDAAEAALAHSALEAADLSAQLDAMHEATLKQDKLFKELQELNRHLTNQKTEAERLLALREADAAQLQHESVAVQQAERSVPSALAIHHAHPGPQDGDWQMSISEAAANHSGKEPSDAAVQRLLEDRRKLQAQVEEEEMEKMRLGAALATLRAEMEALSALRTTSTPGPGLARQLEAAQHDVQRLTSENEALMDISNALTAEKRQADERREAAAKQDRACVQPRSAPPVQYRQPAPWWPQQSYFVMPPIPPPVTIPVPQPVPLQCVTAPEMGLAGAPNPTRDPVHYSHPLMAHQTRTEATAQTMSAPGAAAQSDAGADMAARLQRIEALAAEIARAQVKGLRGGIRGQNGEAPADDTTCSEAAFPAEPERRGSSLIRPPDQFSQAKRRPSQKEKLKALQQRPSVPKVPRVRNWNIVDDTAESVP